YVEQRDACVQVLRLERERAAQRADRVVETPEPAQESGVDEVRAEIAFFRRQCGELARRGRRLALRVQRASQQHARFLEVALGAQRLAQQALGFLRRTAFVAQLAEVVSGVRICRVECERFL